MAEKKYTPASPAELRERGVRLFRDQRSDYASDFKPLRIADQTIRESFEGVERGLSCDCAEAWLLA